MCVMYDVVGVCALVYVHWCVCLCACVPKPDVFTCVCAYVYVEHVTLVPLSIW